MNSAHLLATEFSVFLAMLTHSMTYISAKTVYHDFQCPYQAHQSFHTNTTTCVYEQCLAMFKHCRVRKHVSVNSTHISTLISVSRVLHNDIINYR